MFSNLKRILIASATCLTCLLCGPLAAQDGTLDTTFTIGTAINNSVQNIAVQADGKILIGGNFTGVGGSTIDRIARLNTDGTRDTAFTPGTGANSYTNPVVQPDGKIIVGGNFTTISGANINRIARLNANGSVDTSFNPGTGVNDITVYTVALQPDGKVLIGGLFTSVNGVARNRIARLNADGSLDTAFDPGSGANGAINMLALQSDGKVVIGGLFTTFNGVGRNRIARLNADGSLDTGFDPGTGADNSVFSLFVQSDGRIVVGGGFTDVNGAVRNRVARLNNDGSVDTSFDPGTGPNTTVYAIALQPDGKVLIGGAFATVDSTARNRIARLNANGTHDAGFNPGTGANNIVQIIKVQPDGKVLIGGTFTTVNGTSRNNIARLNNPSIAVVAPAITSSAPPAVVVGQPYTYTVTGTGLPAPTFSFSGLPGWLTFDNVDTISGTPGAADIGMSGVITATATNVGGTDNEMFQIDVQGVPPVITTSSLQPATIGVAYSFVVAATGVPAPTFSSSGLPAWLTLNPATGELTGTPGSGDLGMSVSFDIIADNGWLPNDVVSFQIQVNGVAPVITSTAPTDATVGVLYTYTIAATGSPTPNITVSGEPAWLTLTGNVLSGMPPGSAVGLTGAIAITAANGSTPDATETFQIDVFGQAPTFTTAPVLVATPGTPYTYTAAATGTPAPSLGITSALPAWLSFNTATGELSGTPTNSDARTSVNVTLAATNTVAPDATQTFIIEVARSPEAKKSSNSDGCAASRVNGRPWLAGLTLLGLALFAVRVRRPRA